MRNTEIDFQDTIAPALREYMCNNHTDLNDTVDWVCDVFNLDATVELIDQIANEFDSFPGKRLTQMNYYKITEIEFDFDYEDLTEDEKKEIVDYAKDGLWDSPNGEEYLADVITNETGWCIKSLRYDIIN